MGFMPKGCQHGANTDAETHQHSMPKLVAKKIRNIMQINVFAKDEIMPIQETVVKKKGCANRKFIE